MMYFYVERQGVHGQGVVWVGDDEVEGIREAREWAMNDHDSYHDYILYRFIGEDSEELFRCDKDSATDNQH